MLGTVPPDGEGNFPAAIGPFAVFTVLRSLGGE
jgi:hypothetical protein